MSATLPVKMEVVDMATGEVFEQRTVPFEILPPPATACQVCGHDPAHTADQPHNAQSLYYQYSFYGEHGHWPTWRDALAHCADDVKAHWETHLRNAGAWPEDAVQP